MKYMIKNKKGLYYHRTRPYIVGLTKEVAELVDETEKYTLFHCFLLPKALVTKYFKDILGLTQADLDLENDYYYDVVYKGKHFYLSLLERENKDYFYCVFNLLDLSNDLRLAEFYHLYLKEHSFGTGCLTDLLDKNYGGSLNNKTIKLASLIVFG